MKTFSLVVFALVIVAAITPIASAWAVGDNYQVSWDLTTGQVYTLTRAEANGYCQAAWGTNAANIAIYGDSLFGIHLCENSSASASQVSCMALEGTNVTSVIFNCVSHLTPLNRYKDIYRTPDFTATPTSFPAGTNTVIEALRVLPVNWTFSLGDGNTTTGSQRLNHIYSNPGNYSVIMRQCAFFNANDCYTVTKMEYITVGSPNATKTKYFQTIDGTNGNIVLNSSIQLKDVENSSWVNATGLTADGMSSITTLTGHHINAYAQALGYSDADDLDILNDGLPAYIMMWPTFAKNVSEGNVSLYVTVKDKDTKANIKGAGVTMSPSKGAVQSTTTNEAGIAYFIVTNNTIALITAQAIGQGYQTATTTINTGINSGGSASAAATILLGKNTVTPTFPTVTTLPGGGTPTPTVTILPGCEDQISEEGQAKCRRAQSNQGLSFLSANMGDLIMICVFVTMMYLLGFKFGK